MNTKSINDKIKQFPILNDVRIALDLKNLADKTIINYMDGIARFLDFINYDNLFDINEDHFRDYLLYLHSTPLSKNTINANNAYIRFFFFAVLNKNLNLYRVPKSKFTPKDIDFLFDHQIRSLLNAVYIDSRMDCIIKLALCCGLRINEIISLKISDISTRNRSNMSIYIRKSKRNKSRYVLHTLLFNATQRNTISTPVPTDISSFSAVLLKPVMKPSENILTSIKILPVYLLLLPSIVLDILMPSISLELVAIFLI